MTENTRLRRGRPPIGTAAMSSTERNQRRLRRLMNAHVAACKASLMLSDIAKRHPEIAGIVAPVTAILEGREP